MQWRMILGHDDVNLLHLYELYNLFLLNFCEYSIQAVYIFLFSIVEIKFLDPILMIIKLRMIFQN